MLASDNPLEVIAEQEQEISKLRSALKPFVDIFAEGWSYDDQYQADPDGGYTASSELTVGDVRRARALLETE